AKNTTNHFKKIEIKMTKMALNLIFAMLTILGHLLEHRRLQTSISGSYLFYFVGRVNLCNFSAYRLYTAFECFITDFSYLLIKGARVKFWLGFPITAKCAALAPPSVSVRIHIKTDARLAERSKALGLSPRSHNGSRVDKIRNNKVLFKKGNIKTEFYVVKMGGVSGHLARSLQAVKCIKLKSIHNALLRKKSTFNKQQWSAPISGHGPPANI
ncbi:hypothetical protein L9F63_022149, partial [Diploptera punctata]